MRIETKPIEEVVEGNRKYNGMMIVVTHKGKIVRVRADKHFGEHPEILVSQIKVINSMIGALAKQFPEISDPKTASAVPEGFKLVKGSEGKNHIVAK